MANTVASTPRFLREMRTYRRRVEASSGSGSQNDHAFPLQWRNLKPFLIDYHDQAGGSLGQYFFQDLWAARLVYQRRPSRHVDIGSRIDGFVAHLLTFMPVEVIDIRPLQSQVSGMTFTQADATNLQGFADNSIESLSCLHAVEHFGLGRYGDPIDPDACFAAMRSMTRVIKTDDEGGGPGGGRLYFSVPVGRQRLEFNAQRVFSPRTVLDTFASANARLVSFAAVRDDGSFDGQANPSDYESAHYSCGMFEFAKPRV